MEDVLGGRTDDGRFAEFLRDWRSILDRRIARAVAVISEVDGVVGLVLGGSTGRGEAWPLSDIDLLPIYADDRAEVARTEVERRRVALLPEWIAEGWWTGLDIGRLAYLRSEVGDALPTTADERAVRLADDRWYHGLDKGYRGRAVFDPEGVAAPLADWWTANRFAPSVVALRLERTRRELRSARAAAHAHADAGDAPSATVAIQSAVKWIWTHLLETWGERDASQGRLGTRFAHIAAAHGRADLPPRLDAICALDPPALAVRMDAAPAWVHERHDRSWRARRAVAEPVTLEEDARDTMRVCALYALRALVNRRTEPSPPVPSAWLGIPPTTAAVASAVAQLDDVVAEWSISSRR